MIVVAPAPTMLSTPNNFIPLHAPQTTARSHTFVFRRDELLIHAKDLTLPDATKLASIGVRVSEAYPVGLLGEHYCCVVSVDAQTNPADGFVFTGLRPLFGAMDEQLLAVAGRAYQISEWMRTHRYCGACATPTQPVAGERCLRCPACGQLAYPRISPAMMVLVRRGEEILLAKHANRPINRFTALAGFLEVGESIEDAI